METINVILYVDGNYIIAQGIEWDIAVQGESVLDAKKKFMNSLIATMSDVMSGVVQKEAPIKFFHLLLEAKPTYKIPIPDVLEVTNHSIVPRNIMFWEHKKSEVW